LDHFFFSEKLLPNSRKSDTKCLKNGVKANPRHGFGVEKLKIFQTWRQELNFELILTVKNESHETYGRRPIQHS